MKVVTGNLVHEFQLGKFIAAFYGALIPGETLTVGTDGISLSRDPAGEFFGFDRLVDVARGYKNTRAERVRCAIFKAAQSHEGTEDLEVAARLAVVSSDPNATRSKRLK